MELSTFRELVENLDRILTLSSNEVLWQRFCFKFIGIFGIGFWISRDSPPSSPFKVPDTVCGLDGVKEVILSRFELFFFFRQIPSPCQLSTSMKRRKKKNSRAVWIRPYIFANRSHWLLNYVVDHLSQISLSYNLNCLNCFTSVRVPNSCACCVLRRDETLKGETHFKTLSLS